MKILIDIGHPAHVHYFKNLYKLLMDNNHEVLVVSRDKDIAIELLNAYNIPFLNRGKGSDTAIGKILYMIKIDLWLLLKAKKFNPDLMLSFSTVYPAHVGTILGVPYIGITDTEHAVMQHKLFVPFSEYVITPKCFEKSFGEKHIEFDGYMELSYLHPDYFEPDPSILEELNVSYEEKYTIIRFVSWKASHDKGHKGISLQNKRLAVEKLSTHGKVFICSEEKLPEDLQKYSFPLDPSRLHDAMFYAHLVYGESATMASEAAVMGTHAIFHDDDGRGYTSELEEKYGHVFNYTESEEDQLKGIEKAVEILSDPNSKERAQEASNRIVDEKVSPTIFFFQFLKEKFLGS